jgi:phage repressor protein C with HTH and peptisase S24 domain
MSYEWIREGLKKPGKSQAGLARALGRDPAAVSRLLNDGRQLKASELEIVKQYLGEAGPKGSPRGHKNVTNDGPEDMLRVLGMAEGGPDGWNLWNGEVVQYIRRPDNLLGVPNAYAVYVTGHSMEPQFFSGHIAHIHPGKPVTAGCAVLVQRRPTNEGEPPTAVLKRLGRRTATKIVLEQLNPEKAFEIKPDEIVSMHRVVGSSEP